MRFNAKKLGVVGLVAALIIVVILVTRPKKQEAEPPVQLETTPNEPVVTAQPQRSLFSPTQTQTPPTSNEEPVEVVATDTNLISNWEEKVDDVLRDSSEPEEKATKLLAIFPNLPEAGQVEAAQHIANLISDKDYPQLGHYLTSAGTPSDVIDVLMTDVLNRPDSIKLPTLLEIARTPQHQEASTAKDILELYLEEDYGSDWGKWEQKLNEWLKDHPD